MRVPIALAVLVLLIPLRVFAHANLEQSSPAANASLTVTPSEIRLWFTEPLEPAFSRITLRDRTGTVVETAASLIDPVDAYQMVLPLDALPDGLYTVAWRVISAADGHPTEGSFAFGINEAMTPVSSPKASATEIDETVQSEAVFVRTFHLLAASLALGSIGFWLFVWQPATSENARASRWQKRLIGLGWISLGIASVLLLLLQTSITADVPLGEAAAHPAFIELLTRSSFGALWTVRMGLWLFMGLMLFLQTADQRLLWVALLFGMGVLLTQSLFSHASATQDLAAVAADWLHLLATTLWIGGLLAFGLVLLASWRDRDASTTQTAAMVGYFSNYVRVSVAALIATGFYAAWLHVGSLEALTTTVYGQTLVIKLILFVPVLVLAAINLFWTHRQLQQGKAVWVDWLRGLVSAEIVLLCGILITVGVMTSGRPSRGVQTLRDVALKRAQAMPAPYFGMETSNEVMVHLDVIPGLVGQNEFRISLANEVTGALINDASLIRLRFDNLDESVGQSELRPTLADNGAYYATGANISTPGEWRIRANIQRPGEFDTVIDFTLDATVAPPPPVINIDSRPPLSAQLLAALLTGIALLIVGGFLGGWRSQAHRIGSKILAGAAVAVGLIFLISAVSWTQAGMLSVSDAYSRPTAAGINGAVYLKIENNTPIPQTLASATTSVSQNVEFHQTRIEGDVAAMTRLESMDIAPYSTLEVAPGGLHIMLNELQQDLAIEDTFEILLTFASGLSLPVTVTVRNE